nr:unnamed protein product [Digitaria exilis]
MLRHLGLGCFDAARIFSRCRPSTIPLRWTHHHAPSCGSHPEPSDSPLDAAQDPGWVMLNKYGIRADDTFFAEADTVASCPVFRGRHLRVSIGRAPPPASTFIYYNLQYSALGQDGYSSDISAGEDDKNVVDECQEDDEDVDESEEEEEEDDDAEEWGISVVAAQSEPPTLPIWL